MAVHITDDEFKDSKANQEELYKEELKRDPLITFMDPLGHARWDTDYYILRQQGFGHEQAKREVRRRVREIEHLPDPELPAPNQSLLKGQLRYKIGDCWRDDDGPVVPLFCHFMEAFSAFARGRKAEVRRQCEVIAQAGYHGIRALDVLGYYDVDKLGNPAGWHNKAVTPFSFRSISNKPVEATLQYYEQKRDFLWMLHELGLKLMDDRGDLNAWSHEQKYEHMRRNGQLYNSMGQAGKEVLAGLWACNESWQNGVPDVEVAKQMLREFQHSAGWLSDTRGLSWGAKENRFEFDPTGELPESMMYWSQDPATVITMHGSRTAVGEHLTAHYLGYGFYDDDLRRRGKRCWNTEPIGGGKGVTVGRVDDAERLVGIATEAIMSGQAWTFMSGAGVFWERPIEHEPGFYDTIRLLKWIPKDMHQFETIGHSGARFRGTRIVAAIDDPPTRADYAIHRDGRFVMNVYGSGAHLPFEKTVNCQVIDVVNDHVQSSGRKSVGERLTESYRHSRLVVGRIE